MFNHLGIHELVRVSDRALKRAERLLQRQYFKTFSHDWRLPLSLVVREGSKADARQLSAESEKFVKSELFKYCSLFESDHIEDALADIMAISFEIDEDDVNYSLLQGLYESPERANILLVADSPLVELYTRTIKEVDWHHALTAEEALEQLSAKDIDMILLDLWLKGRGEKITGATTARMPGKIETVDQGQDYTPLSARALEKGRLIMKRVHERFPEIPVFLLSFKEDDTLQDDPEAEGYEGATMTLGMNMGFSSPGADLPVFAGGQKPIDEELLLASVRAGGARGLISTNFVSVEKRGWPLFRNTFASAVHDIFQRLYGEKSARKLSAERKALSFETVTSVEKAKRCLSIRLRDFNLARVIDAQDAGEMVADIERPSTRFDDVIGAKGAKEALQFVINWLMIERGAMLPRLSSSTKLML